MHRAGLFFLVGIFLSCSIVVNAQQSASESVAQQTGNSATAGLDRDCSNLLNSSFHDRANARAEHDNRPGDPPLAAEQQDAEIFGQPRLLSNPCAPATDRSGGMQETASPCSGEPLLNFQMSHAGEEVREIQIQHLPGNEAFFFEAGMTIDADGAPNAYHPDNTGLDDLANAGAPGSWEGLAKGPDGEPILQGPDDPFPGYYISATALSDRSKPWNDPTRYVDASKIPYIVLPGSFARQIGARPGDFSVVLNQRNGKSSYAIFGDVGPSDRIGEGSVALAENLGIRSDARNGGTRRGILYLVFPGSGNGRPRTIDEINGESEKLLEAWGGNPKLTACTVTIKESARPVEGNHNAN
jgi:hypothetical protein